MSKPLSSSFETILSKLQCRFTKGCSIHHNLLLTFEEQRKAADNADTFGTLFMDLPIQTDCPTYGLPMVKMFSYSISLSALKLLQNIKNGVGASIAQKMFSIKDFFSKCDQIRRKLRIWSHILKNP